MSTPPGPQDPGQHSGGGYGATPPPPGGYGGSTPPPPGGGYGGPPAPPSYGGGEYGGGGGGYGGGTEKNSLGVWALVLGIVSILCCGIGVLAGIPAVILGRKSKEAAAQGQANNGTLGNVGMILGWIGIVLGVLYLLWLFAFGGLAMLQQGGFAGATY